MKQEELRFQTIIVWLFDLAAMYFAVRLSCYVFHHLKAAVINAEFETAYMLAAMLFYSFAFFWHIDCRRPSAGCVREFLVTIIRKCVFTAVCLFLFMMIKGSGGSRAVLPLLTAASSFVLICLVRLIRGLFISRYYIRGRHGVLTVLVTEKGRAEHALRRMEEEEACRYQIGAVICTDIEEPVINEENETEYLPLSVVRDYMKVNPVSCVIIDLCNEEARRIDGMSERWLYEGISILRRIEDEEGELLPLQREYTTIGDTDFRYTNARARQERTQFIKRCVDIVLGLAGSLAALLVTIPLAAAIKIGSHGPVFLSVPYVGKDGKRFHVLTYRTTYIGPELKKNILISRNVKDDPAAGRREKTSAGRLIEKLRIGFLPMFFNVLTGSMSIVGVHPIREEDFLGNEHIYRQCLYCKPGLICPAETPGRRGGPDVTEAAIEPDILYAQNWTIWYDVITVADRFRVKYEQGHRTRRE